MDKKTEERIKNLEDEVAKLKATPPPTIIIIQPAPLPPPVWIHPWPYDNPYNLPQITWFQPSITICGTL